VETDEPKPIGVYGRTKRSGEKRIERCDCKAVVIRTAWLYSEYGKNFVKTMADLFKKKDNLKVVGDQIGTPTYAGDLARFIVAIVEVGEYTKMGLYHFTNEGTASWYDFAVAVKNLLAPESNCEIISCATEDYPTRAERPKYSVLSKQKIKEKFGIKIRHWQDSLAVCANKIKNKEKIYEV
jgi:dTDP-4-dehydrorhamnose reductase